MCNSCYQWYNENKVIIFLRCVIVACSYSFQLMLNILFLCIPTSMLNWCLYHTNHPGYGLWHIFENSSEMQAEVCHCTGIFYNWIISFNLRLENKKWELVLFLSGWRKWTICVRTSVRPCSNCWRSWASPNSYILWISMIIFPIDKVFCCCWYATKVKFSSVLVSRLVIWYKLNLIHKREMNTCKG